MIGPLHCRQVIYVTHLSAKESKPLSHGELVRKCNTVQEICAKKDCFLYFIQFNNDTGSDLLIQAKKTDFVYHQMRVMTSNTAQLLTTIQSITELFKVAEELASLKSLHGTTKREDLFLSVCKELELPQTKNKGERAPSMTGKKRSFIHRIRQKISM